MTPEKGLWVAVLARAIEDALAASNALIRDEARAWFAGGQDFCLVCEHTGLDPDHVQRCITAAIERADVDGGKTILRELLANAEPAPQPKPEPLSRLRLTFAGKTLTLKEWSDETGIGLKTLRERMRRGWTLERMLTEEPGASAKKFNRWQHRNMKPAPGVGLDFGSDAPDRAPRVPQDSDELENSQTRSEPA